MREGLGVFVNAELRASLRRCCTVAHVQQLLCGVAEIDVEDWRSSAEYHGAPPPQGRGDRVVPIFRARSCLHASVSVGRHER